LDTASICFLQRGILLGQLLGACLVKALSVESSVVSVCRPFDLATPGGARETSGQARRQSTQSPPNTADDQRHGTSHARKPVKRATKIQIPVGNLIVVHVVPSDGFEPPTRFRHGALPAELQGRISSWTAQHVVAKHLALTQIQASDGDRQLHVNVIRISKLTSALSYMQQVVRHHLKPSANLVADLVNRAARHHAPPRTSRWRRIALSRRWRVERDGWH
jgi:hypothetical protein